MATGEIRRAFFKHKQFGDVFAVEIDDKGFVLAALELSTPEAKYTCKHLLPAYQLALETADQINRHKGDFEVIEPTCKDAGHQVKEIFEADARADEAQAAFEVAHRHAKQLKEVYEQHVAAAKQIRDGYRIPKDLPLFPRDGAQA